MKKIRILPIILCATLLRSVHSYGQGQELEQLALDIEKLTQFKSILSNMKSGYQVISGGYNTVKNISKGNFSLHQDFLNGLMALSPTVRHYKRVAEIISMQTQIIRAYKTAFSKYSSSNLFTASELGYIAKVHERLVKDCAENMDELFTVITAGELRMSDAERLGAIDRIYHSMSDKKSFLGHFTSSNNILILQKIRQQKSNKQLQGLYGL